MKMLMKFAMVALVFCVGLGFAQPSADEFNLFCRIFRKANDMMYGPDYMYDENTDRETIKEMAVLYNATTSDIEDFRKTLWETKDFFEAHPPPTDPKNRKKAQHEIGQLIRESEEKIEENKKIAEEVNKQIEKAKLSVARGIFGDHPTVLPKDEKSLSGILSNTSSIFHHSTDAAQSCGKNKTAGKTLLNDFFCVCVGDGKADGTSAPPCHKDLLPPKKVKCEKNNCCKKDCCGQPLQACCGNNNNCCKCGTWTQMKYKNEEEQAVNLTESFKQIENVCTEELLQEVEPIKNMDALLEEYVGMIGVGPAKTESNNKIFGHRGRSKGYQDGNKVTVCDGTGDSSQGTGNNDYNNEKICVDYRHNLKGDKYDINWHEKFKNYTTFMKGAKKLEDQILKNRADLLLLKSKAWVVYSREKDDETSNLDDMNLSGGKDTMAEKKSEAREYIDVSEEATQPNQPSQPVPSSADGPKYTYISSTEATQEEAQAAPAGGGEPPYIYVSSTGTPSQQTPAPETPSPTQQDPPTQSAKRLREEKKTGE